MRLTSTYLSDRGGAQTYDGGQLRCGARILAQEPDSFCRNRCSKFRYSPFGCTVTHLIKIVLRGRGPVQVSYFVVARIVVSMRYKTPLRVFLRQGQKCSGDKTM